MGVETTIATEGDFSGNPISPIDPSEYDAPITTSQPVPAQDFDVDVHSVHALGVVGQLREDVAAGVIDDESLFSPPRPEVAAGDDVAKILKFAGRDRPLKRQRKSLEDYGDMPAEFRPERWGDGVIRPVRLGDIIFLDQVRQRKNSEYTRLSESIGKEGLHKELDVEVLDADHFLALLDALYFRVHGSIAPRDILDYFDTAPDGNYYPATNGNTRGEIIIQHEKRRAAKAKAAGYVINPYDAEVVSKLRFNRTPEEILGSQISDNFQSAPSQEEVARTTVAYYKYLLHIGAVKDRNEYVRHVGGTLTKDILDGMLQYEKLPSAIHELIDNKALSYPVAIELSKLREKKMMELGLKIYGPAYVMVANSYKEDGDGISDGLMQLVTPEDAAELKTTINTWLTQMATNLYLKRLRDSKFNGARQRLFIKKQEQTIDEAIKQEQKRDEDFIPGTEEGAGGGVEAKTAASARTLRRAIERELTALSLEIQHNNVEKLDQLASVIRSLGQTGVHDVYSAKERTKAIMRALGASGLTAEEVHAIETIIANRPKVRAIPDEPDVLF